MNYYRRHLGDFARDCPNLSQGAVGAYDLLLDFYYATEKPLPLDREQLVRVARAFTVQERKNLTEVLRLFEKTSDGYRHKRVDAEIEAYQAKAAVNRANGQTGGRPKRNPTANPQETQTVSVSDPAKNLSQEPRANKEQEAFSPALVDLHPANHTTAHGTEAGRACRLMREAGCPSTSPHHPNLLAALEEGVTAKALQAAAAFAVKAGKSNPFAYAIAAARSQLAESKQPPQVQTGAPRHEAPRHEAPRHEAPRRLSAVERVKANIRRARIERGDDPDDNG